MHQKHKNTTMQNKLKQLKRSPGLVTSYDLQPGNEVGLFSKENVSKGEDK